MLRTDAQLLRAFIDQDDEPAFRELAERHLDMIYHVALRRSGNPQLAEEAAQNVLILLVRKSAQLVTQPERLPGWLHRAATLEASNLLRSEIRHQKRKQAAMKQSSNIPDEPGPTWKQSLPYLDEALNCLSHSDRQVVVSHYLQEKTHAQIAVATGRTTAAVQRQCHRCLHKLADLLKRRGVSISTTVIVSGFAAESTKAAPATLAQYLSNLALSPSAYSTLSLITNFFKLMTSSQKIFTTAALVSLLTSIPIIQQQQKIQELKAQLNHTTTKASQQPVTRDRILSKDVFESPRISRTIPRRFRSLKSELESARKELAEAEAKLEALDRSFLPGVSSATVKAEIRKGETMVTGGYLTEDGKHQFIFITPKNYSNDGEGKYVMLRSRIVNVPQEQLESSGLNSLATKVRNTLQHAESWEKADVDETWRQLANAPNIDVIATPLLVNRPGDEFALSIGTVDRQLTLSGTTEFSGNDGSSFSMSTRVENGKTGEVENSEELSGKPQSVRSTPALSEN